MKYDLRKELLISEIKNADEKLLRILGAVVKEYKSDFRKEKKEENLFRLVYTSARLKNCTDEDIEQILEVSRRNNGKINVTGILIHTDDRFLQVLEGDKEVIMKLYHKIEKDDRHGGSNMRFCEPVKERHFSDWEMAGKKIDKSVEFKTDINDKKRKHYDSMMDGDLSSYKDDGMRVLKTFLLVS
ncbi:MAG: BLUF domain-containing protein [Ekhidna sp.]